jgi:ADP-ribosyl-[dinitrogen reductase] hydrolase
VNTEHLVLDRSAGSHRRQRVIGALVGSVVGDALGAPFEFGPPGRFTARFPVPARGIATEMGGGGGWGPAEWTDDTQQSLIVAMSLLDNDGLDEADLFARFRGWLAAGPADVGIQTRAVLASGAGWRDAAREHFAAGNRAAGNGSIMRTLPAALYFSRAGAAATADAARRISDLTHGDPAAGGACAIYHLLVAAALDGGDPLAALPDALDRLSEDRRAKWARYLSPSWTPEQAQESNGAVWPTLATAVWALRNRWSFAEALRRVIDIGGDTDTVACVTGGLLGAVAGIQAIPSRWTTLLNGELPGQAAAVTDLVDLQNLAVRLDGGDVSSAMPALTAGIEPEEVLPGIWLSDLPGALRAPSDAVVISLCRTFGYLTARDRRQVYLLDDDRNLDVPAVLGDVLDTIEAVHADGRPVLVHCYGGASRTGLVLRAWLKRSRHLTGRQATAEAVALWPLTAGWNGSFDRALEQM